MLASAGLAEARADARVLVEEATGLDRSAMLADAAGLLGKAAAVRLASFVERRLRREPVFRILGRRSFWTVNLRVSPSVLDPRPDTETVVEAALAAVADRQGEALRVLDLGTGSGAILCAVLAECPAAFGIGVDCSVEACAVAQDNLADCGLADRAGIVAGDWAASVRGRFDLVVSNPPYVETSVIATLEPEVRDHDPRRALDGGPDGLAAYRVLVPGLPELLLPQGAAVVEVGWSQADHVVALFAAAGLEAIHVRRDGAGHARVVMGRRLEPERPRFSR